MRLYNDYYTKIYNIVLMVKMSEFSQNKNELINLNSIINHFSDSSPSRGESSSPRVFSSPHISASKISANKFFPRILSPITSALSPSSLTILQASYS